MGLVRRYSEIVDRLSALSHKAWRIAQVGEVSGYPFFQIARIIDRQQPVVFLSGGMHGEEPAGVEGVLRWLESGEAETWPVNWFILPCINPYGWERNYRRNQQQLDINRQFRGRTDCVEANLVKRLLRGRRFLFSIEFHEDVEATGYYLYEVARRQPYVGEQVLAAVGKVAKINPDSVIDGKRADGRGLILRPTGMPALQKRPQWPMAYHVFLKHSDHLLGSETAVHLPLERRAKAHTVALQTALKLLT